MLADLVWSAALITRHAKSGRSDARNAMLSCLPEATVDELLIGYQIGRPKWTATVRKEHKRTEGDKIQ